MNNGATAKEMKLPETAARAIVKSIDVAEGSGSIARLSIPAFRVGDPGPNPGRSTNLYTLIRLAKCVDSSKTPTLQMTGVFNEKF